MKRTECNTVRLGWIMTNEGIEDAGAGRGMHMAVALSWADGYEFAHGLKDQISRESVELMAKITIEEMVKAEPYLKKVLARMKPKRKKAPHA